MNIEYKKNKSIRVIEIIISIIGFVLFVIGLFLLVRTISFNNKSEIVEARIDSVEKKVVENNGKQDISYEIYVSYSIDGENHEHVLLSGINSFRQSGEYLKVRISNSNKEDARYMGNTTIGVIAMLVIGLGLCGGFAYIYVGTVLSFNSYKEIVKSGRRVDAVITRVYPEGTSYNSKNQYYKIDCEWTEKKFTSRAYKNAPEISEGDIVPVYYLSLRKNQYFVDVENAIINKKRKEDNWTFK